MALADVRADTTRVIDQHGLEALVAALKEAEYRVVAPILREGVIAFGEVQTAEDIPRGVVDHKVPGAYSAFRSDSRLMFAHTVGADSAKRWLFPPTQSVWTGSRAGGSMTVATDDEPVPKIALLGLRSCDLKAIQILDRVLLGGAFQDRQYAERREKALLIGVNCANPAPTCFCESMGAGPTATGGFDLCLTEILDDQGHRFVVEIGSEKGEAVLGEGASREGEGARRQASGVRGEGGFERRIDTSGLKDMLYRREESSRWKEVAARCLGCANCTMVCPTCFCTTIEDQSELDGSGCSRTRRWDSCFNVAFSYIHGGSVRQSMGSRYRQWLTHKLGAWEEQFGSAGCVGCGRCIVWCPAGIDLTEEVAALRDEDMKATTR